MLKGTHDMYTVLTNPPMETYTSTGWRVTMAHEDWQPIYRRQSITEHAQRTANITEWDELHHKLSWNPTVKSVIVLKTDIKDWLNDDSQQWEDGKSTWKLIKPSLPELVTNPVKINNCMEIVEKVTGWIP